MDPSTWRNFRSMSEAERRRRWRRLCRRVVYVLLAIPLAFVLGYRYSPDRPTDFADDVDHLKYGSIGSDIENGLPVRVMRVLPSLYGDELVAVLREQMPEDKRKQVDWTAVPRDWTAFGFVREPNHELPIGFSKRRVIVDRTGLNCGACHIGYVRRKSGDPLHVVPTMPANTVDVLAYFKFLFRCAEDPQFIDRVYAAMLRDGGLAPDERLLYAKLILPQMKKALLTRRDEIAKVVRTPWGPGRAQTFEAYKVNPTQFASHYGDDPATKDVNEAAVPEEECHGPVDFPSIWNQRPRERLQLHWDGNNTSVMERNISAALGAGATRERVDLRRIGRLREWMWDVPAPAYPFDPPADTDKAVSRGHIVYTQYCADCHDLGGRYVGTVVDIEAIGTDPGRWLSFTDKLVGIQRAYSKGYEWEWRNFGKTIGYANHPLDGIWARATLLHNGSVPNMWNLLTPADQRTAQIEAETGGKGFWTGHGVYDEKRLGFQVNVTSSAGRPAFWYDLTAKGNSNAGHTGRAYGTELPPNEKWDLIAFLKSPRGVKADGRPHRHGPTPPPPPPPPIDRPSRDGYQQPRAAARPPAPVTPATGT
ncbi:MAG TPA: hypothetical protein VF796_14315 [Humisphaera sp.]